MIKSLKWFRIIVLAAVIGFAVTGCDNGAPGNTSAPESSFRFKKGNNDLVIFSLDVPESISDTKLTGVLKDGDITLQLIGCYDPETGAFNASASFGENNDNDQMRYVIAGSLASGSYSRNLMIRSLVNSRGVLDSFSHSTVGKTAVKKTDGEWETFASFVGENPVSISGSAPDPEVKSLPESWYGYWEADQPDPQEGEGNAAGKWYHHHFSVLISPFYFDVEQSMENIAVSQERYEFPVFQLTVLGIQEIDDNEYDLILIQPEYIITDSTELKNVFLSYLEDNGYTEPAEAKTEDEFNTHENDFKDHEEMWYYIDSDNGVHTNFLMDNGVEFELVYIPAYCIGKGISPISTYRKANVKLEAGSFIFASYEYVYNEGMEDRHQDSFSTLGELLSHEHEHELTPTEGLPFIRRP